MRTIESPRRFLLAFAWGGALAVAACSPPSSIPPVESVALVTIDTLRGDRFGAGGHPRVRTPAIDRLFRRGTQFSQAFASNPVTLPSHVSLLTGEWPTEHSVPRNMFEVPSGTETIAEVLQRYRIATGAYVSSVALDARFKLDQGFDVYNFRAVEAVQGEQSWRPAPRTIQRALHWWDDTPGRKFLWVHVFEPHMPYEPPPEYAAVYATGFEGDLDGSVESILGIWGDSEEVTPQERRHLVSLYSGEISWVDRCLLWLFRAFEGDENVALILTADHGESLGEHGLYFRHGPNVYATDLNVPLAVVGGAFAPRVDDGIVRLIDVANTVLSLYGVEERVSSASIDLAGRGVSTGAQEPSSFAVATMPWTEVQMDGFINARMMRSVRTPDGAYVETPWQKKTEWFDRASDPGELTPFETRPPSADGSLEESLDAWIEEAKPSAALLPDAEAAAPLEALGYIGR